ncbi:hypothetical protein V8E36_008887 [Tilletia maclaganii]
MMATLSASSPRFLHLIITHRTSLPPSLRPSIAETLSSLRKRFNSIMAPVTDSTIAVDAGVAAASSHAAQQHVLVFGAQGIEYLDQLQLIIDHCASPEGAHDHAVKAFLQACHTAIVEGSAKLPHEVLADFPGWGQLSNLSRLVDFHAKDNTRNAAVNGALLCTVQIAALLLASKRSPTLLRRLTAVSGFCSGILPAAAVALADSPLELTSIGVEMVRLALWIGAESGLAAKQLAGKRRQDSWCLVIHGPQISFALVSQLVEAFNTNFSFKNPTRDQPAASALRPSIYVSSVTSDNNISIAGHPALLDYFESALTSPVQASYVIEANGGQPLSRLGVVRIPVCSLYHSQSTLQAAVDKVLERAEQSGIRAQFWKPLEQSLKLRRQLIFPVDPEQAPAAGSLLQKIAATVLTDVNRWDLAIKTEAIAASGSTYSYVDKGARGLITQITNMTTQHVDLQPNKVLSPSSRTEQAALGIHPDDPSHLQDDRIAVVSVSCRFPNGAEDPESFWKMLEQGANTCQEVPSHLFDWKAYQTKNPEAQRNSMSIGYGNFLANVDKFDNLLFNMSPRESLQLDPQHRFTLMCCYEAMEDAGYVPDQLACYNTTRVGCFIGASSDDYRENASSEIGSYFITGNIRAFIPGHVSFTWNWEGPSNSVDTACSSSLVAIEAACDALLNKQCDSALAGGVTIITQPQMYIGFEKAKMLSPTGQCRTFDESVDGICRGDGVGVVMLKRYSTAIADGDNILGVIRACESGFSSLSKETRLGETSQEVLEHIYRKACARGRVDPQDVSYIDVHGIGTKEAEAAEVNAIANVFGHAKRSQPLFLGSSKPNIGYSEAASGMTAFVKLLKAFEHQRVLGLQTRSPNFKLNEAFQDLDARKVQIPLQPQALVPAKQGQSIVAGISNPNFLGGATFLLLEQGQGLPVRPETDPRPYHIVTISAKSAKALSATRDAYVQQIKIGDDLTVGDISYTSTARRQQFGHRLVASGQDWAEIAKALSTAPIHNVSEQLREDAIVTFALHGKIPESAYDGVQGLQASSRSFSLSYAEAAASAQLANLEPSLAAEFALRFALTSLWGKWNVKPRILATDAESTAVGLAFAGVLSLRDAAVFYGAQAASKLKASAGKLAYRPPNTDILLVVNGSHSVSLTKEASVDPSKINNQLLNESPASTDVPSALVKIIESTLVAAKRKQSIFILNPAGSAPSSSSLGDKKVVGLGVSSPSPWQDITAALASLYAGGVDPDWKAYHADYMRSVRLSKLPNYRFDLQSFWMKYEDRALLPFPGEDEIDTLAEDEEEEEEDDDDDDEEEVDSAPGIDCPFSLVDRVLEQDDTHALLLLDVPRNPAATAVAKGHSIRGRAILPASLYAEHALQAAKFLGEQDGGATGFEVSHLSLVEPYVLDANSPALHVHVQKFGNYAYGLAFTCVQNDARVFAVCNVQVISADASSAAWPAAIERSIARQAKQVRSHGNVLPKQLVYRLFTKAANYSDSLKRISSVAFGNKEAVAHVQLSGVPTADNVVVEARTLDTLAQISTLLPNVGMLQNDDHEVYVTRKYSRIVLHPDFLALIGAAAVDSVSVYALTSNKDPQGTHISVDNYVLHDGKVFAAVLGVEYEKMSVEAYAKTLSRVSAASKAQPAPPPKPVAPVSAPAPSAPAPATTVSAPTLSQSAPAPTIKADEPPTAATPPAARGSPSSGAAAEAVNHLKEILIEELGVEESDLIPDRNLADLGLDSLMSLQVLGSMRDSHDLDLPANLFMDYPTLAKVNDYLVENLGGGGGAEPADPAPATATPERVVSEIPSTKAGANWGEDVVATMAEVGTTKPLLVSGRAHKDKATPLFLLPDGSGTGAAYIETADWGRPVYAVTSPHLVKNRHTRWSVEQLAAKYIECIATILPPGQGHKIFLGGWSFGGVVAFETYRLLVQPGAPFSAQGLVLIDSPDPKWLPLPNTVLDWVYGPNGNPELKKMAPPDFSPSMKAHFDSTLDAIDRYNPQPLAKTLTTGSVVVVNGTKGLGGKPEDVKNYNATVGWLQNSRIGLGAHGWERYIDAEHLKVVDIPYDHFTVCKKAASEELGQHLGTYFK